MEIILNKVENKLDLSTYNLSQKSCFLDIETTGLSRSKNIVYLVGILYYDLNGDSWVLKQIFANKLEEEIDVLLEAIKTLKDYDNIINYNGSVFDIPFLNTRLKHHNIDYIINKEKSFDLYSIIRKEKNILNLKNLKLETLEKYIGIYREDTYSGRDCIKLYYEYLSKQDSILKKDILRHNREDLIYMLEIIKILDLINSKKTLSIHNPHTKLNYEFYIEDMYYDKNFLIINGIIEKDFNNPIVYYHTDYYLEVTADRFHISIETNPGLIDSDKSAQFVQLNNLLNIHKRKILVLSIDNTFSMENIKKLLKIIIENSI